MAGDADMAGAAGMLRAAEMPGAPGMAAAAEMPGSPVCGWFVHQGVRLHYLDYPAGLDSSTPRVYRGPANSAPSSRGPANSAPPTGDPVNSAPGAGESVSHLPPVVLLHAILSSHRLWALQAEALSAGGCRVIVPDLRGHGESGFPAEPLGMETLAGDVIALLDHLEVERFALGGLSLGGMVALRVAAAIPDRVGRLLLASTRAGAVDDASGARFYRTLEALDRLGRRPLLHGVARAIFGATTRHRRDPAIDAWMEDASRLSREALHALTAAVCEPGDDRDIIARVRCPALVLRGEEDTLVSSTDAMALCAGLADGSLREVPKAGHMLSIEAPREVTSLLQRWLEDT